MLEKAALLKAEWVGGQRHPGTLHCSLSCKVSKLQHEFSREFSLMARTFHVQWSYVYYVHYVQLCYTVRLGM